MKTVPINHIIPLRPYACGIGHPCTDCEYSASCFFPHPGRAYPDQFRSVLYETEDTHDASGNPIAYDAERIIVTFDELQNDFESMDQSDVPADMRYTDVIDYLRDAVDNGLHPCAVVPAPRPLVPDMIWLVSFENAEEHWHGPFRSIRFGWENADGTVLYYTQSSSTTQESVQIVPKWHEIRTYSPN